MNLLDLFSGIGGFSLGLERAGMKTVAFCEIEPYPRAVLAKHWPEVPCYHDVRELTAERLAADGISVDVICGGFPCQDISVAGRGAGLAGERSGLWSEYARLIGELRPRYVIVENVAALLNRGLARVLGDLAALGFDAEWHCIPASAVGAPHRRDRLWIVAHHAKRGRRGWNPTQPRDSGAFGRPQEQDRGLRGDVADAPVVLSDGCDNYVGGDYQIVESLSELGNCCGEADVAFTEHGGPSRWNATQSIIGPGSIMPSSWWVVEPDVGRVVDGVPNRVDRLKGLGNAVVPQVVEAIGRAVVAREAMTRILAGVFVCMNLYHPAKLLCGGPYSEREAQRQLQDAYHEYTWDSDLAGDGSTPFFVRPGDPQYNAAKESLDTP